MQRAIATIVAQDKLATECGFDSIVPRMWIGPVNAMTPDGRDFVSWDALWMEAAEGISLDMLTFGAGRHLKTQREQLVDRKIVKELLFEKYALCSLMLCLTLVIAAV